MKRNLFPWSTPFWTSDMDRSASKNQQESIRLQAIDLFLNGILILQIALHLEVSVQSVYLWIRTFKAHGRDGLRPKPQKGNPKSFFKVRIPEIREILNRTPQTMGFDKKQWDGPAIVQMLKRRWLIEIHPKYVYRWLDRNGLKDTLDRKSKSSSR